jgi:N-dimethylarginine dimethylaminohydrolase
VIVTTPQQFTQALAQVPARATGPATMAAALVVSPVGFRISEQPVDNLYMRTIAVDPSRAMRQHHGLVEALGCCGVPVLVFPGREGLDDAVFPNNAFATVPGRFIVGSMRHPVRRAEAAREDIRRLFTDTLGRTLVDLSATDCIAELTGPLVVDRGRGLGFCGLSQRADEAGCAAMHAAFDLRLTFRFALQPGEYHTNVVLSVLAGRACVLDPAAFVDPEVPEAIAAAYPGRTLALDPGEKAAFAGNCLAVTDRDVMLSQTAFAGLRPGSRAALESWGFRLHAVDVDEFEKAGGSLRCLIAEVF